MDKKKIIPSVSQRWSPVSFSGKKITDGDMELLFEAARWAPSSFNEQPWRFFYALHSDDEFPLLVDFLHPANKVWAQHAAVLAISFASLRSQKNNKPNRFAFHDTGMALGNLLAQATSMGISVHQMGGYSVEKVRNHFRLAGDIEPVAMMALGYHGGGAELPEEVRRRESAPRERRPLSQTVYKKNWEQSAF